MAELTATDVETYTSGRLADDDATEQLLTAALAAARRFCGWHVTGVREGHEVTLDGPGSTVLTLPTLKVVELTDVVEDGSPLDVSTGLYVSRLGLVRKRSGIRWSRHYGSITVTMTHGFDEADDFNAAVLSFVDRASFMPAGGRPRVVGPFQYETDAMGTSSAFSAFEQSLLAQYRLEWPL